jgi:hypothetical protein
MADSPTQTGPRSCGGRFRLGYALRELARPSSTPPLYPRTEPSARVVMI